MKIAISPKIDSKINTNYFKNQEKTTQKQTANNSDLLCKYLDNMALISFAGSYIIDEHDPHFETYYASDAQVQNTPKDEDQYPWDVSPEDELYGEYYDKPSQPSHTPLDDFFLYDSGPEEYLDEEFTSPQREEATHYATYDPTYDSDDMEDFE